MATFGTQMEFTFSAKTTAPFLVNTHTGKLPTSSMGITLVHEHIFNRYPSAKKDDAQEFAISQLDALQQHNVKTIIDLTPYTTPGIYEKVLEKKDINIICCIGFYLNKYVPSAYRVASLQELVSRLSKQIEEGRGRTGIRPGILKVAGQHSSMTTLEQKFFTTVGILQQEHHIPIATHSPKGALSHLDCLLQAGANPEHIFFSHLDKGIANTLDFDSRMDEVFQIMDRGAYILLCEFGSGAQGIGKNYNNTIRMIEKIRNAGYINHVLLSADSSWRWKRGKIHLKGAQWGGIPRTYEYVFRWIVPVIKSIGFTEQEIRTILVDNPKRLFEYKS